MANVYLDIERLNRILLQLKTTCPTGNQKHILEMITDTQFCDNSESLSSSDCDSDTESSTDVSDQSTELSENSTRIRVKDLSDPDIKEQTVLSRII
jgi:hypothetical protein